MGSPSSPHRRVEAAAWVQYTTEFVGTFLFQLLGSSTAATMAPVYNGLILAVLIYMTANTSGGVLNPAVAITLMAAGEMSIVKCIGYCLVQCGGAALGAVASAYINVGFVCQGWSLSNTGPGCGLVDVPPDEFTTIFAWESIGTFVLCSTVLATVIAKPGFGDIAPAAIGAAVAVMVAASGAFTGGFYNTARFFGPSIIFGCGLNLIWLYFLAHLVGAWLAAAVHRYALFPSERASALY